MIDRSIFHLWKSLTSKSFFNFDQVNKKSTFFAVFFVSIILILVCDCLEYIMTEKKNWNLWSELKKNRFVINRQIVLLFKTFIFNFFQQNLMIILKFNFLVDEGLFCSMILPVQWKPLLNVIYLGQKVINTINQRIIIS